MLVLLGVLALAGGALGQADLPALAVHNGIGYGVDTTSLLSSTNVDCLYRSGYKVAFLQIYADQQPDSVGISNVRAAYAGRLAFEVFVNPSPIGYKDGRTQANEALANAKQNSIVLNRVWLQVTNPLRWSSSQSANYLFLSSFISAARAQNVNVGLYTSWYDLQQIVGSSGKLLQASDLWYWHTLGVGSSAETKTDFTDFRTFGPFVSLPLVKQYGIGELPCSVTANRNVFATANANGGPAIAIGMGARLAPAVQP